MYDIKHEDGRWVAYDESGEVIASVPALSDLELALDVLDNME